MTLARYTHSIGLGSDDHSSSISRPRGIIEWLVVDPECLALWIYYQLIHEQCDDALEHHHTAHALPKDELTQLMGNMPKPMGRLMSNPLACNHEFMKDTKGFRIST